MIATLSCENEQLDRYLCILFEIGNIHLHRISRYNKYSCFSSGLGYRMLVRR